MEQIHQFLWEWDHSGGSRREDVGKRPWHGSWLQMTCSGEFQVYLKNKSVLHTVILAKHHVGLKPLHHPKATLSWGYPSCLSCPCSTQRGNWKARLVHPLLGILSSATQRAAQSLLCFPLAQTAGVWPGRLCLLAMWQILTLRPIVCLPLLACWSQETWVPK